jgi:hypothetical protein
MIPKNKYITKTTENTINQTIKTFPKKATSLLACAALKWC